jgi:hypothetical protein
MKDDDDARAEVAPVRVVVVGDEGDPVVDEGCHVAVVAAAVGDAGVVDAELVVPGMVAAAILVAEVGTWGTETCSWIVYADIGRCPGEH